MIERINRKYVKFCSGDFMKNLEIFEKHLWQGADSVLHIRHYCGDRAIHRHWHGSLELLYFIRGNAVIHSDTDVIRAEPGDLIVINSHEIHFSEPMIDSDYYCLIMSDSLWNNCQQAVRFHFPNQITPNGTMESLILEIVQLSQGKKPGYFFPLCSAFYALVTQLIELEETTVRPVSPRATEKNLAVVNRVQNYICRNYREPITVDRLAELVHYSNSYLSHTFRELTGYTIITYLQRVRISYAEQLLCDTEKSVREIADLCGFCDYNYFSHVFKKLKTLSPRDFRRMHQR